MEAPLMHLALVGTPNSGKTALFNALTGSRQKVANYPGVTVERKEGSFVTPKGRQVSVVDLPGTYSLRGRSPDEEITRDIVLGRAPVAADKTGQNGQNQTLSGLVRQVIRTQAPDKTRQTNPPFRGLSGFCLSGPDPANVRPVNRATILALNQ